MNAIDVVVLSRSDAPLPASVVQGLSQQSGVRIKLHRVIGSPQPDRHRWDIIARGRNEGRKQGTAPWLMFLDDDVVLRPNSIAQLVSALEKAPQYAALAADYLGASPDGRPTQHVGMGATVFRRHVLNRVPFRWERDRCECRCMCDDLRRLGWGIRYAHGIRATHLKNKPAEAAEKVVQRSDTMHQPCAGHILAALDRRHLIKFRRQFLGSLRQSGNRSPVSVVAYGWYPSEVARFSKMPGVRVFPKPNSHVLPPVRRLLDFQEILRGLEPHIPVAYWDAADVIFQDSLQSLWQLVQAHSDKLLAVREPTGFPTNPAVFAWTQSIANPLWRERAYQLLQTNPFLNSGFAAGTAQVLLQYFQDANRMRHGPELEGSTDWGDQMALNLYCHLDANRWIEVASGWNYCAHNRAPGEVIVRADRRVVTRSGAEVHVVHGNAHSFRKLELSNR